MKKYKWIQGLLIVAAASFLSFEAFSEREFTTGSLQTTALSAETEASEEKQTEQEAVTNPSSGVILAIRDEVFQPDVMDLSIPMVFQSNQQKESDIYTFLQGPKSWGMQVAWSGIWCQSVINRNSFAGFGCGLCCMANIYSTLSPYECSPLDMLDYARKVSSYYPTKKAGAISWDAMQATLAQTGITSNLQRKPATYEEFQKQIAASQSAVVLISSAYDQSYWKDVAGHYVNIYLYNAQDDTVFLADPGDPEKNRNWIPLKYVYLALKTVSQYQYLCVTGYNEDQNQWKWNQINVQWVRPS